MRGINVRVEASRSARFLVVDLESQNRTTFPVHTFSLNRTASSPINVPRIPVSR